jgi:hypothetical protein
VCGNKGVAACYYHHPQSIQSATQSSNSIFNSKSKFLRTLKLYVMNKMIDVYALLEQCINESAKADHYYSKGWYKIYYKQLKVVAGIKQQLLDYELLLKSKN